MEDGRVLRVDDPLRRRVERLEVDVLRAPVARAQLLARDLKARAQLDQRQHDAAVRLDAFLLADVRALDAPEVRRRELPAVRAREVDEPAGREPRQQALARLLVDQLPARIRDRRVSAQQVVAHRPSPRRLPIPSEPPVMAGAGGDPPPDCSSPSSSAAASAASPCSTMSPSWNSTPLAI